jgi:hypothetical protein
MTGWFLDYLFTLGLTIVLEAIVIFCLTHTAERYRLAGASIAINLFTHPLASFFNDGLLTTFVTIEADIFVAIEATIMVTEAILYRHIMGLTWSKSVLLSGVANAATIAASFCL